MKLKLALLFLPLGLAMAVACTDAAKPLAVTPDAQPEAAAAEHPDDAHDAPRISLADAKKDYDAGTAIIVDVRDVNAYKNEHVKGALNITLADLEANLDKLPKGKKIIAYCS